MNDKAHAAVIARQLQDDLLASLRAFMRQAGGPDRHSMCKVLDTLADEFRVLTGGFTDDWQNTAADRIKESSDELDAENYEAPEIFPGVRAQLDALTIWRQEARQEQRARFAENSPL